MATRPSWAADVDHDVAQAIYLHLLLSGRRPPNHADVLARAARTASAALFRGLMEFFHDGRPTSADWARSPCDPRADVTLSEVLQGAPNAFTRKWSKADLQRFCDADKLVGHVTKGRATRRRMRKEWGCPADWKLLL